MAEKDSGFGLGALLVTGLAGAAAGYYLATSDQKPSPGVRSVVTGPPTTTGGGRRSEKKFVPEVAEGSEWESISRDDAKLLAYDATNGQFPSGQLHLRNVSLDDLSELFGEAHDPDDGKVRYEWYFMPEDGTGFVSLYDYESEEDEPKEWSVSGFSHDHALAFAKWLRGLFKDENLPGFKIIP